MARSKDLNVIVSRVLKDAKSRGIISDRIKTLAHILDMSRDQVAARTRTDPIATWTDEQLRAIMGLLVALDQETLAGRILRAMFDGWDICFRSEIVVPGASSGNVHLDGAAVVEDVGHLLSEIAGALDDERITPEERDRLATALNECHRDLATVAGAIVGKAD